MAVDLTLGFNMPELIVESIIRDGFQNIKDDLTIIDRLFSQLARTYNQEKYGTTEIDKIKTMVQKPIAVVYDYGEVDAHPMTYSIMIGADDEDRRRAHMNDFAEQSIAAKTPAIVVPSFVPTSYDPNSGLVRVPDGVDLTNGFKGQIFVDNASNEFELEGGVNNLPGQKCFVLAKHLTIDLGGNCLIRSFVNFTRFEVKQLTSDVKLVIGVHSKDALTTKYLYLLLKYFIFSRKFDMISRGLYVASFNGSDFTRDKTYQGDKVYTRFCTVIGKVDDRWRADEVQVVEQVDDSQVVPIDESEDPQDEADNFDPSDDDPVDD